MTDISDRDRKAAIVDARLAAVVARRSDRLSEDDRALVRSRIERSLHLAGVLRTLPLGNADEPEIVFVPYRGEP